MAARGKLALQVGAVAIVALLLGLLGWRVIAANAGKSLAAAVESGDAPAAPDFELPLLGSKEPLRLSSLRGKVVVLNFWASWCVPCKEEAPILQAGWERWRGKGVQFLGVDAQDFIVDAKAFVKRYGITYPSVHDATSSTLGRYGVTGFPETFFVSKSGKLVAERVQGPVTPQQLDRNIELALAAP